MNRASRSLVFLWRQYMKAISRSQSAILGFIFVASVCLSPLVPAARAQVGAASLSGVVQDPTGAVIPTASVTVKNLDNGNARTIHANKSGAFSFASLPSGNYELRVETTGFEQFVQSPIHLNPGDSLALADIRLEVGAE